MNGKGVSGKPKRRRSEDNEEEGKSRWVQMAELTSYPKRDGDAICPLWDDYIEIM